MKIAILNAIATGLVAVATILGLMAGFYYNLKSTGISIIYIVAWEIIIPGVMVLCALTMWRNTKDE